MTAEPATGELIVFIVRVSRKRGALSGVVERVRTGEKRPFRGAEVIGQLIERLVAADTPPTTTQDT